MVLIPPRLEGNIALQVIDGQVHFAAPSMISTNTVSSIGR